MSGAHMPVSSTKLPPAPGGSLGSKAPGMIPDRSTVPGHINEHIPKAVSTQRPLTQYGTAEEIMAVFKQVPADQLKPDDFEQATATYEERRKANPADLPPAAPEPVLAPLEVPEALADKAASTQ